MEQSCKRGHDQAIHAYVKKNGYSFCNRCNVEKRTERDRKAMKQPQRFVRPENRIWLYINKNPGQGPDGNCWEWQASRTPDNYGRMSYRGRPQGAHRLVWIFLHGPIPPEVFICHRCDNPPCCNPAHLFAGSAADNANDMARKGRHGKQKGKAA